VQDVLDMASGINCLESDDPDAYTTPGAPFYIFEGTLGMLPPPQRAWGSTYEYMASLTRLQAPGQVYQYTSVDTCVLGWLAERLTGLPYAELVQRELWSHIGAEADAAIVVSPAGIAASHGGVSSTLRDLARYGLLYTPSWSAVSPTQVIPDAYLHAIQAEGRRELLARAADKDWSKLQGERPRHNANQWDMVMADGDFFKAGFCGQGLWVSPSRELVVAYFGHAEAADAAVTYARTIALSGLFGS
jgi:CubicO group peptidase (beta-lactamase class C family)